MKKILAFLFTISLVYFYLNGKCVSFGYDNIAFSNELLCAKSTVSEEYQYEVKNYTPLRELEGDAKEYAPRPKPVPTLDAYNF
jgi:hypothetical protein